MSLKMISYRRPEFSYHRRKLLLDEISDLWQARTLSLSHFTRRYELCNEGRRLIRKYLPK